MQEYIEILKKRGPFKIAKIASSEVFLDKNNQPFITGNEDVSFSLDGCTILEMEAVLAVLNKAIQ